MTDFPLVLTLAQSPPPQDAGALPPPPGEGTPIDGTAAPGGQPGTANRDPMGSFFPLLLLVLAAMIIFTVFGQRRDKKKRQALLDSVKKHDRVQTVGGVIGSIVELKPDTVVLKVDESSNIRITFARSAIQQVLTTGPEAESSAAGAA